MNIEKLISDAIEKQIQAEIHEEAKKVASEAQERLERRVHEIVSGVCIRAIGKISMERFGTDIVIRIKMDDH